MNVPIVSRSLSTSGCAGRSETRNQLLESRPNSANGSTGHAWEPLRSKAKKPSAGVPSAFSYGAIGAVHSTVASAQTPPKRESSESRR